MTFKSILVHAEPGLAAEPRLAAAVAVARMFDAELTGLGAAMFDWVAASDPYGFYTGDLLTVLQDKARADMARAEAAFLRHAAAMPHRWRSEIRPPTSAMCASSRSADLIVAGGAPLRSANSTDVADSAALALDSGRPVLVAPPKGGVLTGHRVVVAWKDTREARRALADALPFLKRAADVVVLEACDAGMIGEADIRTAEVARSLHRHDVPARGRAIACAADRVATELKIEAQAIRADLIVAGAYGHTRAREWLLGGVTHELLHEPETFVLLSH